MKGDKFDLISNICYKNIGVFASSKTILVGIGGFFVKLKLTL